jgi:hypothetical protein
MFSTDRNNLMPAQEKLEWVTPKISLMDAVDSRGSKNAPNCGEGFQDHPNYGCVENNGIGIHGWGPS